MSPVFGFSWGRPWRPATAADLACLEKQLRRPPRQVAGVARRCARGCPAVVVSYPLSGEGGKTAFFPTLFYLTCPAAVKAVSRWEDEGGVRAWQTRLQQESVLRKKMDAAHREYLRWRNALISPAERRRLGQENPRLARDLATRGIGGLLPGWTLKCLHLHYAHYLATGHNPVGQGVEARWSLARESKQCPGCTGLAADQGD